LAFWGRGQVSTFILSPSAARSAISSRSVPSPTLSRSAGLHFLPSLLNIAELTGITFHAAIAFLDQQSPHNPSGTTNTSAAFPHPGHFRAGDRSSTFPTAFINRINPNIDIAASIVLRFHASAAVICRIVSFSPGNFLCTLSTVT
jgi:hypothetical protein